MAVIQSQREQDEREAASKADDEGPKDRAARMEARERLQAEERERREREREERKRQQEIEEIQELEEEERREKEEREREERSRAAVNGANGIRKVRRTKVGAGTNGAAPTTNGVVAANEYWELSCEICHKKGWNVVRSIDSRFWTLRLSAR